MLHPTGAGGSSESLLVLEPTLPRAWGLPAETHTVAQALPCLSAARHHGGGAPGIP